MIIILATKDGEINSKGQGVIIPTSTPGLTGD